MHCLGHACAVEAVQGLFGPVAIAVICFLLFVEEAGVPLPMFPASGLLLVAGVMIASGDISPWFFVPIAYVSNVGGALLGYTWSRRLGQERLERLADRLRVRRHLDRVAERLQGAGAIGIGLGRVLPGTRVYTSLIAGVIGVPLSTFVRGLFAADAIWLGVLVGLGVAVGIPAADYLHVAVGIFMRGVVVVVALLGALAVLRLVRPAAGRAAIEGYSRALRVVMAIGPDVLVVAVLAVALSITLIDTGVLTDGIGVAIVVSLTLLGYVAAMRLAFGSTPGERLGRLSYGEWLPGLL